MSLVDGLEIFMNSIISLCHATTWFLFENEMFVRMVKMLSMHLCILFMDIMGLLRRISYNFVEY